MTSQNSQNSLPVHPMVKAVRDVVAAAGQTEAFESAEHFHLSVENAPYMRLVIESWAAPDTYGMGNARRVFSVAHYAERECVMDDPIVDTDLEMLDNGAPLALTFAWGRAYTRIYSRNAAGQVMVAPRAKREVESFARMWARNLRAQGFIKAAKVQAKAAH